MGQHDNLDTLQSLVDKYPWWSGARLNLLRNGGCPDMCGAFDDNRLVAIFHPAATLPRQTVDISRLTHLSDDDIIDRFLNHGDYRITAPEDGDIEDIVIAANDDDEDMVSEDLAEIYKNQGLYDEAIATYRKLSLLNSKKSIYFAGLISELEQEKERNK